jgi:hypothetical protein
MTDTIIVTPSPATEITVTPTTATSQNPTQIVVSPEKGPKGDTGSQGIPGELAQPESAPNVYYVSKSGNDSNDGSLLSHAFLTIKAALTAIAIKVAADPLYTSTVFVKNGEYTEQNPLTIPTRTSIVGDSLRSVSVIPANLTQDIFYVNNACYVKEITFKKHEYPAAAIAFPPTGAGVITASPYIYNCSSITTTGTGMRIDGSLAQGGKSMVSGQFTQVNQGGYGIHIINQGYAQLVSIYTIACDYGIWCESGGFCSLIGSDTSFGNYGLVSDGVSVNLYHGTNGTLAKNATTVSVLNVVDNSVTPVLTKPRVNNVVKFTGDSSASYYTVDGVQDLGGGNYVITLLEPLANDVTSGTANFFQRSLITASGHTFEYAGAGTDLRTALPQAGGIPDQTKEIRETNGGKVFYTSTDQKGDFRIGNDLMINRASGTIQGVAFDKSLFAVMTPYILAIEG